jgi:large-conductance mechanosensitive channel
MRKIKSTALLGAFVAIASVGVISHEAHGTTVTSIVNTIAKEALPSIVPVPAPVVTPSVNYPSNASVTLTLSGATFRYGPFYKIVVNGGSVCGAYASYSG